MKLPQNESVMHDLLASWAGKYLGDFFLLHPTARRMSDAKNLLSSAFSELELTVTDIRDIWIRWLNVARHDGVFERRFNEHYSEFSKTFDPDYGGFDIETVRDEALRVLIKQVYEAVAEYMND